MPKVLKVRELIKKLRDYDERFEFWTRRGKGSELMIYHPDINGRTASFPIKCHGKGDEVDKGYYPGLVRRFKLPSKLFK